ncbi:hypothetical protein HK099_001347 [Clydaea vesicula]|uniref:J domain-containing protein n=1 Tax=Clydaea vesicula TaxID=447962 RepID=A0AAD5U3J4_9FUNG|nr:hypothetical protein HK099_001347 [Clydaea vesicula]KAJ3397800.1 hypothetical protein HDU92_002472 [Lobulomyces angularis]
MSNSSSTKTSSNNNSSSTESDWEKSLRLESNSFNQEKEVDRILKIHKITENPVELLELSDDFYVDFQIDLNLLKKVYRSKSLLVHPDKNKHPRAGEAFELMKQASNWLEDKEQRSGLISMAKEARAIVFHQERINVKPKDQPPKTSYLLGEPVKEEELIDIGLVKAEFKKNPKLLFKVKNELRKVLKSLQTRNEIRQKNEVSTKTKELELAGKERKRKADERISEEKMEKDAGDWRSFQKNLKKKKKF